MLSKQERLTDEQVKKGFNEVYNQFWLKNKSNIPGRDSEEWDRIHADATALRKKYPFLDEVVIQLEIELDERMREEEINESKNINARDFHGNGTARGKGIQGIPKTE